MKIAFLTEVYKPIMNGVVISIENFTKGLRKLGNQVYIFAPRYPNYRDKEKYVYRFKMVQKIPANYYVEIPISVGIGNRINECDIVHVHHPFMCGWVGLYRSKIRNIPLVFTHHTIYEEYSHYVPFIGGSKEFKKWLNDYVVFFCNNCDCIIAPTESIKKRLKAMGVKPRIEAVPTGIDIKRFRKAKGEGIRKKYSAGSVLVIYVGRIAKEKNMEFLVDVAKELSKKNKNVKFVFVGEGPLRERMEKGAKKYKNIIFVGRVKEVEVYYKAADVFISASKTETQGIVFVEAKAAGLPVVALNAAGARDIVKDNEDGLLAETKKEFKENLLKLIKNRELRERMSKKAVKNSESYSIEATSRRMLEVYKKLISEKNKTIQKII